MTENRHGFEISISRTTNILNSICSYLVHSYYQYKYEANNTSGFYALVSALILFHRLLSIVIFQSLLGSVQLLVRLLRLKLQKVDAVLQLPLLVLCLFLLFITLCL